MGAQLLGGRKTRKVAAATGLPVAAAWAHGGEHRIYFATAGHRHGWYDPRSGEWDWKPAASHYESCPPGDPS